MNQRLYRASWLFYNWPNISEYDVAWFRAARDAVLEGRRFSTILYRRLM